MHIFLFALFTTSLNSVSWAAPATRSESAVERNDHVEARSSFAGFRASPAQPDGVYQVFLFEDGTESEHIRIGDSHAGAAFDSRSKTSPHLDTITGSSHHLDARQAKSLYQGVQCSWQGAILNGSDVEVAVDQLARNCDEGGEDFVRARASVYTKSGSVVAYVCNYSPNSQHCTSTEVMDAIRGVHELDQRPEAQGVFDVCGTKAGKFRTNPHTIESCSGC